ncbi:hypothetical protein [Nocardioides sp. YIM 152588]|uniref:hypothetical protein n=1 Tax=Nocardioides sp. YIM 152588 TaxID=3158259 RepID=UPI0032E38C83
MSKGRKTVQVSVSCGTSKPIEAYDADGNPVTYQVVAAPPPPATGGVPQGSSGGSSGGGGSGGGGLIHVQPRSPVVAQVMAGIEPGLTFDSGVDLYVGPRVFAGPPASGPLNVVTWQVSGVTGAHLTLDLPEGMELGPDTRISFMLGLEP